MPWCTHFSTNHACIHTPRRTRLLACGEAPNEVPPLISNTLVPRLKCPPGPRGSGWRAGECKHAWPEMAPLFALELKSDSPYPQLAESGILLSQFVLGFDGYLKMRCRYPYLTRAPPMYVDSIPPVARSPVA